MPLFGPYGTHTSRGRSRRAGSLRNMVVEEKSDPEPNFNGANRRQRREQMARGFGLQFRVASSSLTQCGQRWLKVMDHCCERAGLPRPTTCLQDFEWITMLTLSPLTCGCSAR